MYVKNSIVTENMCACLFLCMRVLVRKHLCVNERETMYLYQYVPGGAHIEDPCCAGFYGDLRKAVTKSGSFSGLISVLLQRRTCVQPPASRPLPLNPTNVAGHRQPIKPGLGGHLHTPGCSGKRFWTRPTTPSPHTLLFFHYFFLSLFLTPSFSLCLFHSLPFSPLPLPLSFRPLTL